MTPSPLDVIVGIHDDVCVFVRIKRNGTGADSAEYLQIVESLRENGRVRQRVVASLGRRDELVANGILDGLVTSLAKFSEKLRVVEKVRTAGVVAHETRAWGPSLVFERLWTQQGLPKVISSLARERKFSFDVERVCFALALQRLCAPGSDLFGSRWLPTVEAQGFNNIQLRHMYRTVGGFLAPHKEELERHLFFQDRDLFGQTLDVLFVDTTSTYVYAEEDSELRKHGYSRDHRGDLRQVMLCVAVDKNGWPVAWDILPGNTADPTSMRKMLGKLRKRFSIGRAVIVGDRGMASHDALVDMLSTRDGERMDYVVGCRMRQDHLVDEALSHPGRFRVVKGNLEVKEVKVGGQRFIVCRNPEAQARDAADREEMLERLRAQLDGGGAKALLANRGYKRFLKVKKESVVIDETAIEEDARFDGKFVLRTSTDLPADEVALTYRSLWRVERTFRETKSTLDVRPLFHRRDDACIGHIVACFLALRLEVDLQRKLDEAGVDASWSEVMLALDGVRAIDITVDEQPFLARTEIRGLAQKVFKAVGVGPPPLLTRRSAPAAAQA
jgi:hypothetical protein